MSVSWFWRNRVFYTPSKPEGQRTVFLWTTTWFIWIHFSSLCPAQHQMNRNELDNNPLALSCLTQSKRNDPFPNIGWLIKCSIQSSGLPVVDIYHSLFGNVYMHQWTTVYGKYTISQPHNKNHWSNRKISLPHHIHIVYSLGLIY